MTQDKWQDLVHSVEEKYDVLENEERVNEDGIGTVHILTFEGPGGRVRLEFIVRPVKLTTKTHYSRRIGSAVTVENEYSETDNVCTLKVYLWQKDGETWQEVNSDNFSS